MKCIIKIDDPKKDKPYYIERDLFTDAVQLALDLKVELKWATIEVYSFEKIGNIKGLD